MKRCFALLSALLLSALLLTSFAGSLAQTIYAAEPAQTEARQTVTQTELPEMAIVSGGAANYTVVRSEDASSRTVTAASQLVKRIENYTGIRPKQDTDWHKEGTELDSDTLQILVGQTAYPESADALRDLAYGDYVVKQTGRKLVINAWSDEALEKAMTPGRAGNAPCRCGSGPQAGSARGRHRRRDRRRLSVGLSTRDSAPGARSAHRPCDAGCHCRPASAGCASAGNDRRGG